MKNPEASSEQLPQPEKKRGPKPGTKQNRQPGKERDKPGRKPTIESASDPTLAAEWEHLRVWWATNGGRYSVRHIAKEIEDDPIAIGQLLQGKGRSAASRERLNALRQILGVHYLYTAQE
ncbi:hypothetical protein [Hymenobacter sediminicola]|uniref:Uncharacterized protein n=1 Tax=Hymenobacter sediminicola TaxID=2761579 RepID=A0A7G7W774_9BACT|nr:hypothetical protein [Hymenobacter sediminicola]QNH62217.1 hypothetical protein H4317_19110 [Hymenobacter sediminicola]